MISVEITDFASKQVLARTDCVLSSFSANYELDKIPTASLILPIEFYESLECRAEIKVTIDDYVWCGLVDSVTFDKNNETAEINMSHIFTEWLHETVPMNLAVKQLPIPALYGAPLDFQHSSGWAVNFDATAAATPIEYLFSRQNKIEALNAIIENTEDIHFRISPCDCRSIDVGAFGATSGFIMGEFSQGSATSVTILGDVEILEDWRNIVNRVKVVSGNESNGMGQMTLINIFKGILPQLAAFPVSQSGRDTNTEGIYSQIDAIEYAPNYDNEYIIDDLFGQDEEKGVIYESTFAYNDLYPIHSPEQEITNQDRLDMEQKVYERGIRHLVQSRRKRLIQMKVGKIPCNLKVGDKFKLSYNNEIIKNSGCYEQIKKIVDINEEFVMISMSKSFDKNLVETNNIIIDRQVRTLRFIGAE